MTNRYVTWPSPVRRQLLTFRSPHFTPEETLDFIAQFILDVEDHLTNEIVGRFYTEERGQYRGISRVVVRGFKVYFETHGDEILILALKFPRQN